MNNLLFIAVILAVAVVMALRGCPRSRGNWHKTHYSRKDSGSIT